MPERATRLFQVRCTRHGKDAGTSILPALDVDDAVARAIAQSAQCKAEGLGEDPFEDREGLEVWVRPFP